MDTGLVEGDSMSDEVVEIKAPKRQRAPRPVAPPPPNPTVVAFQQQLVPLVEKREIIQSHVRQAQRELQEAQNALGNHQQALQDTEAAINYRLNMIAQLTGQPIQFNETRLNANPYSGLPAQQMAPAYSTKPALGYPQQTLLENLRGDAFPAYGDIQHPPFELNTYAGEVPNLAGNPNIPSWVTSIPSAQNQRYSSGYVPNGPDNPRSESAVDVREDPKTQNMFSQIAAARKAAQGEGE